MKFKYRNCIVSVDYKQRIIPSGKQFQVVHKMTNIHFFRWLYYSFKISSFKNESRGKINTNGIMRVSPVCYCPRGVGFLLTQQPGV